MKLIVRLLLLAAMPGGAGVGLPAVAHSPPTAPASQQGVRWLQAMVVDPQQVARDGMQSVTAAVRLTQRAAMPMQINIELAGSTPVQGNPAMQRVACVWTYRSIYLSQRKTVESFPIYTGDLKPRDGASPATVPKTITITARLGSERVSTSFTVNCPL